MKGMPSSYVLPRALTARLAGRNAGSQRSAFGRSLGRMASARVALLTEAAKAVSKAMTLAATRAAAARGVVAATSVALVLAPLADRAGAVDASGSFDARSFDTQPQRGGFQPYVPQSDSLLDLNLPRLGDAGGAELSPSEERKLGDSIVREMRSDGDLLDDPEASDFLNRFAGRLTDTPPARGFSFEFFLVKDPTMNAFALPGGAICVHTGLFAAAQSESELASVLAHEMGHVIQRHIARMLAQQKQTSMIALAGLVLGALAARAAPQAAMGAMTMGMGASQQMMLSFSRDAEREADRIGFDILTSAGYDPNGMVAFFGRLQQASSLYEGPQSAPAYLRTHPLTTERIADMQSRIRALRYVQRPDSLAFRLIRARLAASGDTSTDGLIRTKSVLERQLREKTTPDEAATMFAIANVTLLQRDYSGAQRALDEARRRVAPPSAAAAQNPDLGPGAGLPDAAAPLFDRIAIEIRLQSRDANGALAMARNATQRSPQSRSLVYLQAQAMVDLGQSKQAAKYLEDQLALYRSDANLWRLLAVSYSSQGNEAQAHRASAEEYALSGGWMAAIDQLKMAQRSSQLDFYTASQVDSRLQELQKIYAREKAERNKF